MQENKDKKDTKDNWLHQLQSKKYLQALSPNRAVYFLGEVPQAGFRINFFFFKVDYYVCDTQPVPLFCRGLRIVVWDKREVENSEEAGNIKIKDMKIKGWLQVKWPFKPGRPHIAYLDNIQIKKENYFKNWSKTLKYYRHKWLKNLENKNIEIVEVDINTFIEFYKKANMSFYLKRFFTKQMQNFKKVYKEDMHFYLIKDLLKDEKENVIAGTCILDDKEIGQAIYMYVFTYKRSEYKYIGVGIIDFCVQYAIKNNLNILNLTAIYTKGQDKTWRGFTEFKMHFDPKIAKYNDTFVKFTLN